MQSSYRLIILLLINLGLSTSEKDNNELTTLLLSRLGRQAPLETIKKDDERISQIKCKEYAEKVKCTKPADVENNGYTYVEDALNNHFPHMVLLLEKTDDGKYKVTCDGTLISPRFILTAEHCMESVTQQGTTLVARLGDRITDYDAFDGVNQVEIPVKNVYKNPNYTSPTNYHIIGLLELAKDVSFTEYIRPACLWNGQQLPEHGTSVTSCTAYNMYNPNLELSKKLQKFNIRAITNDECKAKGVGGLGVTDICAIHPPKINNTHCLKYSGAPLQAMTTYNQCVSEVIGVAGLATTICGSVPAIFARVSFYIDWIEEIVWQKLA